MLIGNAKNDIENKMTTHNQRPVPAIWPLGHIAAPSDIELHGWKCFDLTPPGKPTARHFLGLNGQSPSVYTSAPVTKFNPVQGVGEATDGAVIRLAGPPCSSPINVAGYIEDVSIAGAEPNIGGKSR